MFKTYDPNERERVALGILGAFLFSLIGAVLWVALWDYRKVAAVCGIISIIAAVYGYEKLGKKLTLKGSIISIVVCTVVLVATWHIGLSIDLYQAVTDSYLEGVINARITFVEALKHPYFLFEKTVLATRYIMNLVFSVGLCIVFGVGFAVAHKKSEKKAAAKAQSRLNGESWDK